MTRDETKTIIATMMTAYPNYKPENLGMTVDLWASMFEEYPYKQVSDALKTYIKTDVSGFAPAPGQIIDKMQIISVPEELDESEAWSLVSRALRNGIYHSVEEFSKLPETVQKAVGTHEQIRNWAMDENFNEEVARSGFVRVYRQEIARNKEYLKMPEDIRKLVDDTNRLSGRKSLEDYRKRKKEERSEQLDRIEDKKNFVPMPEETEKKLNRMFSE